MCDQDEGSGRALFCCRSAKIATRTAPLILKVEAEAGAPVAANKAANFDTICTLSFHESAIELPHGLTPHVV